MHWFNNIRIHGLLSYLSPVEYKLATLKKVVLFSVDIPMNYGYELDGMIGLDLLQKIKAIINSDKLTIEFEKHDS